MRSAKLRCCLLILPLLSSVALAADDPAGPPAPAPVPIPAPATPALPVYPIQLTRAEQPGSRFRIQAKGSTRQVANLIVAGRELPATEEQQQLSIDFDATVTLDAVDPRGQATRLTAKIKTCTVTTAQATRELAPQGSTLRAQRDEPATRYTLDGEPVSAADSAALDLILNLAPRPASDDAVFGNPRPQRPGATWPLDAPAAAASLAQRSLIADPANVRGQTTFVSLVDQAGVPCLELRIVMAAAGVRMPQAAAPPDLKIDYAHIASETVALYPQDPALPRLREQRNMTLDQYLSRADPRSAPRMQMRIREQRSMSLTRTPLPAE